jgi:hypothetical protein
MRLREKAARRRLCPANHYFSFEQSRGVMPFSFAYCAAEASIMGRTIDWS